MGWCKCFLRSVIFTAITVAIIVLIPNLPPYAEITKSISIPKTRPLVGPLAINEKLRDTEIWHKGKISGAECFAEYNGELYTSLQGGIIAKFKNEQIITVAKTGKSCKAYYEEKICGRPLGLRFDKNGVLYVADAYYGILRINIKTGQKEVIVSPDIKINGKKPKLFNSLALAGNGDIYWSDSSTQFHLENLVFSLLSDPTGRLIHYDSKTKTNKILIDNLHFANGVILSNDEEFVLVAETMLNRIHRYYLKGPKKGTSDVFIDGLPGVPDNLQSDGKDGFLVSLIEPIDEGHPHLGQLLFEFPLLRKFLARLLGLGELVIETVNKYYSTELGQKILFSIGHYSSVAVLNIENPHQIILRLSKSGQILETLSTTDKKLRYISDATIFDNHLYLGSPINDYVGRIHLSKLGWEIPLTKRSVKEEQRVHNKQEPKPEQVPIPKKQTTTPSPKQETTTPLPKTTTTPPKKETAPTKPITKSPPNQQTTTQPPKQETTTPSPKTTTPSPKTTTPSPKTTTPSPKKETAPTKPITKPSPNQQTPPSNEPTPIKKSNIPPSKEQAKTPPKIQAQTPPSKVEAQTPPPKIKVQTAPPKAQAQTPPPKVQAQTPPPKVQSQTPPPKVQAETQPPKVQAQTQPPKVKTQPVPDSATPLPKPKTMPPSTETIPPPKQQNPSKPTTTPPKRETPPTRSTTPPPKKNIPSKEPTQSTEGKQKVKESKVKNEL